MIDFSGNHFSTPSVYISISIAQEYIHMSKSQCTQQNTVT